MLFLTMASFSPFLLNATEPGEEMDRTGRADALVSAAVEESRTIVHRKTGSTLFYVRLKARIGSVEKGRELIRGAEFLDIRCWREGAAGHVPIPADGAVFRAWLVRHEEGFWTPLEPDGFELAEGAEARTFPEVRRRPSLLGYVLGGLFGLAVLCTAAVVRYRGGNGGRRSWGAGEPGETPPD